MQRVQSTGGCSLLQPVVQVLHVIQLDAIDHLIVGEHSRRHIWAEMSHTLRVLSSSLLPLIIFAFAILEASAEQTAIDIDGEVRLGISPCRASAT